MIDHADQRAVKVGSASIVTTAGRSATSRQRRRPCPSPAYRRDNLSAGRDRRGTVPLDAGAEGLILLLRFGDVVDQVDTRRQRAEDSGNAANLRVRIAVGF
jgi:hypothetical protein